MLAAERGAFAGDDLAEPSLGLIHSLIEFPSVLSPLTRVGPQQSNERRAGGALIVHNDCTSLQLHFHLAQYASEFEWQRKRVADRRSKRLADSQ